MSGRPIHLGPGQFSPDPDPPPGPKGRLVRNSARCDLCGDEIESTHRHDYVACSCGHVAVDGGLAYARRCWGMTGGQAASWTDTSKYEEAS